MRDANGAAVSSAMVRLAGGSASAEAETGSDGRFICRRCQPVSITSRSRPNIKNLSTPDPVELTAEASPVDITLSANNQITIFVPDAQSGATGGEALSSKQVSQLPLNKRDFSQLLLLAAGTMTDANGATNFTQQFAINGQRGVEATFAMDGADISDPEMGGSTFSNFNVDAVQELQSSSGWMPAEIGRGASGFTDIITRSGAERISRIDLRVCAQLRLRCAQLF